MKNYSKKQIFEALSYWQKQLKKQLNEYIDDNGWSHVPNDYEEIDLATAEQRTLERRKLKKQEIQRRRLEEHPGGLTAEQVKLNELYQRFTKTMRDNESLQDKGLNQLINNICREEHIPVDDFVNYFLDNDIDLNAMINKLIRLFNNKRWIDIKRELVRFMQITDMIWVNDVN